MPLYKVTATVTFARKDKVWVYVEAQDARHARQEALDSLDVQIPEAVEISIQPRGIELADDNE
jgi:Tfp pilus assembly protein PilN